MVFGNLKVEATTTALAKKGKTPPKASPGQATGASDLIAQLETKWNVMFMKDGRLQSANGEMRMDMQKPVDRGETLVYISAIQNNTSGGAKANSHSYSTVETDSEASLDKANVAGALQYAHQQSFTTAKIYTITLVTPVVKAKRTTGLKCGGCEREFASGGKSKEGGNCLICKTGTLSKI